MASRRLRTPSVCRRAPYCGIWTCHSTLIVSRQLRDGHSFLVLFIVTRYCRRFNKNEVASAGVDLAETLPLHVYLVLAFLAVTYSWPLSIKVTIYGVIDHKAMFFLDMLAGCPCGVFCDVGQASGAVSMGEVPWFPKVAFGEASQVAHYSRFTQAARFATQQVRPQPLLSAHPVFGYF